MATKHGVNFGSKVGKSLIRIRPSPFPVEAIV